MGLLFNVISAMMHAQSLLHITIMLSVYRVPKHNSVLIIIIHGEQVSHFMTCDIVISSSKPYNHCCAPHNTYVVHHIIHMYSSMSNTIVNIGVVMVFLFPINSLLVTDTHCDVYNMCNWYCVLQSIGTAIYGVSVLPIHQFLLSVSSQSLK